MIKILILEDNLKALRIIMEALSELEAELDQVAVTVFSEGKLGESFLKNFAMDKFDVVLLDYVSRDEKTFHQIAFSQIDPRKIIAISNTEAYNRLAEKTGVLRSVQKNYLDLMEFKRELKKEIKSILI